MHHKTGFFASFSLRVVSLRQIVYYIMESRGDIGVKAVLQNNIHLDEDRTNSWRSSIIVAIDDEHCILRR